MIDPVCGMVVSGEDYSTEHQNLLYAFCSDLCKQSFLQQPKIYIKMHISRIKERNKELELVRTETIQCLSRAAEYKDNETGEHILRMASHCKRLAMLSGLNMRHVQLIEMASPMHDIGKIGIPEHILLKQGPLDVDERRVIQ
ncbi:MAG: YHS domain-containing protein, partial [Mariprofundaceae bacterium]|nr:YHS domain-containing protein [Mariprofundaceae bacterium]